MVSKERYKNALKSILERDGANSESGKLAQELMSGKGDAFADRDSNREGYKNALQSILDRNASGEFGGGLEAKNAKLAGKLLKKEGSSRN